MSTEIPIWVNGKFRWLSGIDKKTTCKDVIEVLLEGEGIDKSEMKDFTIMERWRKMERPLDENSKILRIWSHWGNEKKEVRLCLRRVENEVDSGRGSPVGSGNTPSLRRKRNRSRGCGKPPWAHTEILHPRRLAELGRFNHDKEYDKYHTRKTKQNLVEDDRLSETSEQDNRHCAYEEIYEKMYVDNMDNRKKSGHKSYHCSGTGKLHSTLISDYSNSENYSKRTKCCSKRDSNQKTRNSENIEKLMKLILAQGATIQSQLQKLKEREEQIESIEHERHRERVEKNGRNYLLETYLGSLKDAEIPVQIDEEKGNDSGVLTEGGEGDNQINSLMSDHSERLNPNETEPLEPGRSNKVSGRRQIRQGSRDEVFSGQYAQGKSHQKSTRSKSESRTQECKVDKSLKRTLSDNTIKENVGVISSDNEEIENCEASVRQIAKEEPDEVVELRRIQSQIEMWEKVFKINKKLEKEEENLVRLHIKIKKFQSENYRIAKDNDDGAGMQNTEEATSNNDASAESKKPVEASEQENYEQSCEEVQQNLETLRSDLEQNSKEIYQNFTRLIEEDEKVEQKRNCLTKLISDLERTNHEQDMLNEMIAMRGTQEVHQKENPEVHVQNSSAGEEKVPESIGVLPFGNHVESKMLESATSGKTSTSTMCSKEALPHKILDNVNQRTEATEELKLQPTKPKIVKISFEDQIRHWEASENGPEKMVKEPPSVAPGALKSILKNRKYSSDKELGKCNLSNESQQWQKSSQVNESNEKLVYHQNFNTNVDYVPVKYPYPSYVPERIHPNYSYPIPQYNHFPYEHSQNYFGQPPVKEDFKTAYSTKNPPPQVISRTATTSYPHSTMVTTKAVIHNDTDSSTSSDTSGLSSMYSSSPTVEEPYVEQSYVLDTLV